MTEPLTGDIEPRRSTRRQARSRVKKIKKMVVGVHAELALAYRFADHVALGYTNTDAGWKAYVSTEYQNQLPQIEAEERKQLALMFAAVGMSQRKIAASVGASKNTIEQDLKGLPQIGPDVPPAETLGADDPRWTAPTELEPDPLPLTTTPPDSALTKPAPTVLTLRTHVGDEVVYRQPAGKPTFNYDIDGEGISWAAWSWNPVTGCLHGCEYCYARAIAHRFSDTYPVGFTPLFHHERLDGPANTVIPAKFRDVGHQSCGEGNCKVCAHRRVFVCSMADLYGRWVPDEWISQVHKSMLDSPQWEYLLLTKFPARYVGLDLPPNAWVGTSVDEQKRVRIAEDAFRKIDGVKVKWLSLEPLREPLEFSDLSMFDWVVIGAQTETRQPSGTVEAFMPPWEWICRITVQAKAAGCRVHWKPNLLNGRPGLPPNEYPQ